METTRKYSTVMSTAGIEDILVEALDLMIQDAEDGDDLEGARVTSFGETGLMTRDKGVVLRLNNGFAVQIGIVKSANVDDHRRNADEPACPNCDEGGWYDGRYCGNCGWENDDMRRGGR